MQANWSLILNVLLLIGVIVTIGRLMKARKQGLNPVLYEPSLGATVNSPYDAQPYNDDIIAVRKVSADGVLSDVETMEKPTPAVFKKEPANTSAPQLMAEEAQADIKSEMPAMFMMFLLAKENRQFAGYELLQTLLAAGLRFGEGQLFHRHQYTNGQGPVICSLAAATETGVFDLQNIGAFSVRGLCLFMELSQNTGIDEERFNIMLETAKQLSEGLDAHLLDFQRKPLTEDRIANYYKLLNR